MRAFTVGLPILGFLAFGSLLLSCASSGDTGSTEANLSTEVETSTSAPASTTASTTPTADAPSKLTVERGAPIGTEQTEPEAGEVKLWVSNQSFEDDPVKVTIAIDGAIVVDENFEVKGQHNWIGFFVKGLAPGPHKITATSDTGVEYADTFTVIDGRPRWLVLDYYYYPDDIEGRQFIFVEADHSVAFA